MKSPYGNFSVRMIPVTSLIIVAIFTINSCKDSLGIDQNAIKTALNGDTISVDTSYVNFKKVVIHEIVKQNDTTRDTVVIETKDPLSSGRVSEFTVNFIYSYQEGLGQYKTFPVKINGFDYLTDTLQSAILDYNSYLPIFDFKFLGRIRYDNITLFPDLDTITSINFTFSKIDLLDLLSSNKLDTYFQKGSKVSFGYKVRYDNEEHFLTGNDIHYQQFCTFLQDSTTGKISNLRIDFTGGLNFPSDSTMVNYNGFFRIAFK